jgi:hypothetical protein
MSAMLRQLSLLRRTMRKHGFCLFGFCVNLQCTSIADIFSPSLTYFSFRDIESFLFLELAIASESVSQNKYVPSRERNGDFSPVAVDAVRSQRHIARQYGSGSRTAVRSFAEPYKE